MMTLMWLFDSITYYMMDGVIIEYRYVREIEGCNKLKSMQPARFVEIARAADLMTLLMTVDIAGIEYDRPIELTLRAKSVIPAADLNLLREFCRDRGIEVIYRKGLSIGVR